MPASATRGRAALRWKRLVLCLAAGVAMTACELPEQSRQQTQPAPRPASPGSAEPKVAVPAPPQAKPKAPLPPVPPARPTAIEPQVLVGLGEDDITQLLGEPREVRNDPPAMVWNYTVGDCKFDLFFYLDLKSQDFRALAYNFEPNTTSDEAKKACLAKIQEANRDRRR
jgi:hypothetical protein